MTKVEATGCKHFMYYWVRWCKPASAAFASHLVSEGGFCGSGSQSIRLFDIGILSYLSVDQQCLEELSKGASDDCRTKGAASRRTKEGEAG